MIISKTPLRISFVGGGSDFKDFYKIHDGKVLSAAIDKHIYVILRDRFDDNIVVNYSRKEIVQSVDDIQHELVREAIHMSGLEKKRKRGLEIVTLADIPSEGSGLGSSSAVTVGLLKAFYAFLDREVSKEQLAKEACEIEIEILKKPIGKQDQYACAYGGINKITFQKDESVLVENLELDENSIRDFSSGLMLFFTNRTRKSNEILSEQKSRTSLNMESLIQMAEMTDELKVMFTKKQYDSIGKFLHKNWLLKKNIASKISNAEIDEMYDLALSAGATGGKIAGAGGGGFLLLAVPYQHQSDVRKALSSFTELHFSIDKLGSRIVYDSRI